MENIILCKLYLNTSVVRSWTGFPPIPPPIKVIESASRVSAHTLVADQARFQPRLETGCCKMIKIFLKVHFYESQSEEVQLKH